MLFNLPFNKAYHDIISDVFLGITINVQNALNPDLNRICCQYRFANLSCFCPQCETETPVANSIPCLRNDAISYVRDGFFNLLSSTRIERIRDLR